MAPLPKSSKNKDHLATQLFDQFSVLHHADSVHDTSRTLQWILPEEYYTPGEDARYLSEHNVMLQCDQRYGKKEMAFVADKIKEYFRR